MILSEIMVAIGAFVLSTIGALGYAGIFVLMAMESMIFPVPSEFVMPFAGFLVAQGKMDFALVTLASSLGSIAGSLLSYYIGMHGGHKFIRKYGKYFLLDEHVLTKTEDWFKKRGEQTIFISRFVPAVRHVISLPAGMGKMNLKKFSLYTLVGATLWNMALTCLGMLLGENWLAVRQYTEPISILVAACAVIGIAWFAYHRLKK